MGRRDGICHQKKVAELGELHRNARMLYILVKDIMRDIHEHIERLRAFAIKHTKMSVDSIHGVSHWDRVAKYAEDLSTADVDLLVVKAFAYLHDVERENENDDPQHGPRAAALVDEIRSTVLGFLNDKDILQLKEACRLHTTTLRTEDVTVNACFDADRLDLGRVGIAPDPDRMATVQGSIIAERMIEDNPESDWLLNGG